MAVSGGVAVVGWVGVGHDAFELDRLPGPIDRAVGEQGIGGLGALSAARGGRWFGGDPGEAALIVRKRHHQRRHPLLFRLRLEAKAAVLPAHSFPMQWRVAAPRMLPGRDFHPGQRVAGNHLDHPAGNVFVVGVGRIIDDADVGHRIEPEPQVLEVLLADGNDVAAGGPRHGRGNIQRLFLEVARNVAAHPAKRVLGKCRSSGLRAGVRRDGPVGSQPQDDVVLARVGAQRVSGIGRDEGADRRGVTFLLVSTVLMARRTMRKTLRAMSPNLCYLLPPLMMARIIKSDRMIKKTIATQEPTDL